MYVAFLSSKGVALYDVPDDDRDTYFVVDGAPVLKIATSSAFRRLQQVIHRREFRRADPFTYVEREG